MSNSPYVINLKNEKDTAEDIATKLNSRKYLLNKDVINELIVTRSELDEAIGNVLKKTDFNSYTETTSKKLGSIYDSVENGRKKMSDLRFHGAGVSRSTKVIASIASSATPSINTDLGNMFIITAQAVNIVSFTSNLGGTPVQGQTLWLVITGTSTLNITWGSSFESSTITLPTTGAITTSRVDLGFVWNDVTKKWRLLAQQ